MVDSTSLLQTSHPGIRLAGEHLEPGTSPMSRTRRSRTSSGFALCLPRGRLDELTHVGVGLGGRQGLGLYAQDDEGFIWHNTTKHGKSTSG